jgi:Tol biopolymer transport system component
MDADGSNPVRLTTRLQDDGMPSWSPDGTRIAYIAFEAYFSRVYTMTADGSDAVPLQDTRENDLSPAWFPLAEGGRR